MIDLAFLSPWVLSALAVLPVIYLLLRVMPPAARRVMLPTIRFLHGLKDDEHTPSHTPWWLLLLRLCIAGLIIVALAEPVYKPASPLPGSGTVRVVIDNGWAAAQNWEAQHKEAQDYIKRAGREDRSIVLLTTAPRADGMANVQSHPLPAAQALSQLDALEPMPWAADYGAARKAMQNGEGPSGIDTLWFGHGIDGEGMVRFARALTKDGTVTYFSPAAQDLPVALALPRDGEDSLSVQILSPTSRISAPKDQALTLQALNSKGQIIDQQTHHLSPKSNIVSFTLPEGGEAQNVSRIRIAGIKSAGSVLLFDDRNVRRTVGIISPLGKAESQPFVEASYYIKRALSPYANLVFGSVSEVMEASPSLLILPDIGTMPPETLEALDGWVRDGGTLLRFAGANMVKEVDAVPLVPVDIRSSERAMDGAMTWETPATLAAFPEHSPFYGLDVRDDIEVRRQILAQPSPTLQEKTWAQLSDGTPLVSADRYGAGRLILVHTTASPAWSDLSISGLYVEMLRRITALSGQAQGVNTQAANGQFEPLRVMDGFGGLQEPGNIARPVDAKNMDEMTPSVLHPPGIYGRAGVHVALNIGDGLAYLKEAGTIGGAVSKSYYGGTYTQEFMPFLLAAAFVLFLIDWIIMLVISGSLPFLRLFKFACILLILGAPVSGYAQGPAQADLTYANTLYMAHIKTGDQRVDQMAARGLRHLGQALANRTSAEPAGVVSIDLERDTLAFFPFIYWPISTAQETPSAQALEKVQSYLDHGGTILFDTRHRASQRKDGRHNQALQAMIGSLNIPPLRALPSDHVLGRSFYLLDRYPGLYSGDRIWVEKNSAAGRDGVSSVIIGSHDWAGAWANAENGRSPSRQYELSLRFGVNVMMYALTGNYKEDQVHMPAILERLGR